MNNIIIIFFAFAGVVTGFGTAFGNQLTPQPDTNQAMRVELSPNGLSEIAAWIRSTTLNDIEGMPLPDINDKVDGVEVKGTGITLSARFGAMSLTAGQNILSVRQQVVTISVSVDSLRMRKKILGNWVSTTCNDTEITAGDSDELTLSMNMGATASNRQVTLTSQNTSFDIPDSQFDVDGPRRCSGSLGVGDLIRLIAHSVLQNSRNKIEDAVEDRIEDLVPALATNINNSVTRSFEVDVMRAPMPSAKVTVSTFPSGIRIAPGMMTLELGADVRAKAAADLLTTGAEQNNTGSVDMGAVGVNPTLITEAFKAVFPGGTPWTELNAGNTPGISDALDVTSAAGIWPDLNEIPLTNRKLRLSLRVPSAPIVAVHPQNNYVALDVPQLDLMFMAEINGRWQNYFLMQIKLNSGLVISRNNRLLTINLSGQKNLEVSGRWADGYTPVIPIFEQDVAELIFKSLIDFLYDSGPLTVVEIPDFQIGNTTVTAGNIALQSPYINVRILKLR